MRLVRAIKAYWCPQGPDAVILSAPPQSHIVRRCNYSVKPIESVASMLKKSYLHDMSEMGPTQM